jgi:hypothetical protein
VLAQLSITAVTITPVSRWQVFITYQAGYQRLGYKHDHIGIKGRLFLINDICNSTSTTPGSPSLRQRGDT